jgi:DNA repair protein RecO (recombination protein O)
MKFSDQGIIISQKNYSENSTILKIFSQNYGLCKGFVKKKSTAIFQVGNLISFEWRSRIEDALGSFYRVDLIKSYSSKIIFDALKLNCVNSLFTIINSFLERENHLELFTKLMDFLENLESEKEIFLPNFIKLELEILKRLGYALDLSLCVLTNSRENLTFVSPKSGRAVCENAAKPYKSKLLALPLFLIDETANTKTSDIASGLKLSGHFLEKFVTKENPARERIIKIYNESQPNHY